GGRPIPDVCLAGGGEAVVPILMGIGDHVRAGSGRGWVKQAARADSIARISSTGGQTVQLRRGGVDTEWSSGIQGNRCQPIHDDRRACAVDAVVSLLISIGYHVRSG